MTCWASSRERPMRQEQLPAREASSWQQALSSEAPLRTSTMQGWPARQTRTWAEGRRPRART